MRGREGQKPILSPDQLDDKVVNWQITARKKERQPIQIFPEDLYDYKADRDPDLIDDEHGLHFIKDVIPKLIKAKEGKDKVRILDIGGGIGIFTEELRKRFRDAVQVYSTGLRKQPARIFRRKVNEYDENISRKLHHDDLKWRSVLQLSDFPEFDLIIDTYGEQYYGRSDEDTFEMYLRAIIAKLNQGGLASITPIEQGTKRNILEKIKKETGISIAVKHIPTRAGKSYVLRMYKPINDEPSPYENPTTS